MIEKGFRFIAKTQRQRLKRLDNKKIPVYMESVRF